MKKARSGSLGSIASTSPKPTKKSYFILSCPTSPSSSRSSDKRQADCIKQMESLQKENFSLKIRLQFLERKVFNSERDLAEILKHNDLLKNELKSKEMYLNEIMRKEKQKKKGQKSETAEPQTYNSNRMAGTHIKSLEDIDLAKDLLQKSKTILELEEKLATSKSKSASLEVSTAQRLQQAKDHFLVLEAAFEKQRQVSEKLSATCEALMKELQLKDEEIMEVKKVICLKTDALEHTCKAKEELAAVIKEKEAELKKLQELNQTLTEKQRSDKLPSDDLFRDRTQFTVHSPAMKTDKVVNPEGMKMSAGMSEAQKLIHVFKEKERAKKTDGPGLFPLPEFYTQPPPVENPYRERDFKLAKQNIDIFKRLQQVEESKDIGSVSEFNLGSDMNLTSDIDPMHLQPIRRAYKMMMSLTEKSAIDAQIVQRAFEIYKAAHAKNMTKSYPTLNVCCAALFVAFRESKSPRTFKEIADLGCISTRALGRVFIALNRAIDLNVEQVSVHDYLERFSAELNLPFIVKEAASHIVEKLLKMDLLLGCSQITVAASIIFIACYASPFRKTEQEIADACTVSQATIKNHVKKMLPVMKKLFPEEFPYKNMIPSLTVE